MTLRYFIFGIEQLISCIIDEEKERTAHLQGFETQKKFLTAPIGNHKIFNYQGCFAEEIP